MADGRALVWRAFDAAERALAPRVEEAVRSGAFLGGLGLAARVQAGARRRVEARTRALWHLLNLPAGTDVARLRREVAALDRELHRLSTTLERALADLEAPEEVPDADDPRRPGNGRAASARRAAGARPPGRRAQRAARP